MSRYTPFLTFLPRQKPHQSRRQWNGRRGLCQSTSQRIVPTSIAADDRRVAEENAVLRKAGADFGDLAERLNQQLRRHERFAGAVVTKRSVAQSVAPLPFRDPCDNRVFVPSRHPDIKTTQGYLNIADTESGRC